jgi:PTH2 family peptidyl-tRNA hydrolase
MEQRRVKQVLVVRKDLHMRSGKIAAQASHASMKVLLDLMVQSGTSFFPFAPYATTRSLTLSLEDGTPLQLWLDGSFTKIVVSVNSESELDAVYQKAQAAGLLSALIVDNGYTEFHGVPTKTVVAIGPAWADEIDLITGGLPLL